jgi:hypothetical protein
MAHNVLETQEGRSVFVPGPDASWWQTHKISASPSSSHYQSAFFSLAFVDWEMLASGFVGVIPTTCYCKDVHQEVFNGA